MIRDALNDSSAHAIMALASENGEAFQWRPEAGAESSHIPGITTVVPPKWLKLVRMGDVFTGYTSSDGDGWDIDHNGRIEGVEHLNNLEEYCGGSFDWGPFKGHNLDPQGHYEKFILYNQTGFPEKAQEEREQYLNDTQYIRDHGGFHSKAPAVQ